MNKDYPSGTQFEIELAVVTDYFWMDEAEVIEELLRWQSNFGDDTEMHIRAGSVRATLIEKGPE